MNRRPVPVWNNVFAFVFVLRIYCQESFVHNSERPRHRTGPGAQNSKRSGSRWKKVKVPGTALWFR